MCEHCVQLQALVLFSRMYLWYPSALFFRLKAKFSAKNPDNYAQLISLQRAGRAARTGLKAATSLP
jgi:hypothetical protein